MKLFEEYKLYENMWEASDCKGADYKKDLKEDARLANHRVVLADYDTDDFDINVEFGMQDPEENEVEDYEYLLEPGQTAGDLVVWLSRDCGYTSIYVHDERPATPEDIERLSGSTFPVTGTGDEWSDYGDLDEAKTEERQEPLTEARSVADIEAEIARLQQELAQAKEEEKRGIKSAGLKEAKGNGLANISDEEIIRTANVERGLGDIVSSPKTPREKEVNDNIISWWRDNAPQLDQGQMTPEMFNAGFRSIIGMRNGKYEPDSLFDRDWEFKQLSKRK